LPLNNKGDVLAGAVEGCRWSRVRALQASTTQQRGVRDAAETKRRRRGKKALQSLEQKVGSGLYVTTGRLW